MTYSVLTTVSNSIYKGRKFFLYKQGNGDHQLTVLTEEEANKLKGILDKYPSVFSEITIEPKEQEEIKLPHARDINSKKPLDFAFENVFDNCPGIDKTLENEFDEMFCGIDRDETKRLTYIND